MPKHRVLLRERDAHMSSITTISTDKLARLIGTPAPANSNQPPMLRAA